MGKIIGQDCCYNDWKSIIKELWAKYQTVIRIINYNGSDFYPDGDGRVNLPDQTIISGYVGLIEYPAFWRMIATDESNVELVDNTTYWTMNTTE